MDRASSPRVTPSPQFLSAFPWLPGQQSRQVRVVASWTREARHVREVGAVEVAREDPLGHSDIGWAAVLIGVLALLTIAGTVLEYFTETSAPGYARPPLSLIFSLLAGVALGVCAVALWNVRTWARWVAVFLFAFLSVGLALERSICFPVMLFPVVYLLLPSTAKRFAQARELERELRSKPTPTAPDP